MTVFGSCTAPGPPLPVESCACAGVAFEGRRGPRGVWDCRCFQATTHLPEREGRPCQTDPRGLGGSKFGSSVKIKFVVL